MMSKSYLTSRELAMILGVSESSVKRWVDAGLIPSTRTSGGHRRIAVSDAVEYVRKHRLPVPSASILGFAEAEAERPDLLTDAQLEERLYMALESGQAALAIAMIHGPFLAGRPLAWIFDNPVRRCMHRLGELWQVRPDGIMIEHRATEICVEAVSRVRATLNVPESAPLAVGGAAPTDPYILPTLMAATVLNELGMRTINLGADTPVSALTQAANTSHPRLVWYSFSGLNCSKAVRDDLLAFADELERTGVPLIIGGRELGCLEMLSHRNIHIGNSMSELVAFARGLLAK